MRSIDELKPFALELGDDGGAFRIKVRKQTLTVVASWGCGWDHVSVSLPHRCPTWEEMEAVKRALFQDDELAVQYNMPPSKHISVHPYTLHLWRPQNVEIPLPPAWMV